MGLALRVFTPPTKPPVTLEEVKVALKVEYPDEDAYLATLIQSARELVEEELGRTLVETVYDYQLDGFPCGAILLPRPPAIAVVSVNYVALDGSAGVWDAADRRDDVLSEPARITPAYGKSYPQTQCVTGAVTVRYRAGYCPTASDPALLVPAPIRQAILMLVHEAFDNRNPVIVGTIVNSLPAVPRLLAPYRLLLPAHS